MSRTAKLFRWIAATLAAFFVLALLALAGALWAVHRSVPALDGQARLTGLGAPLTIRRDDVLAIKVPRDAPAKTAGLAVGLLYGALLGLFLRSDYD